jgi:hypothetical protein
MKRFDPTPGGDSLFHGLLHFAGSRVREMGRASTTKPISPETLVVDVENYLHQKAGHGDDPGR